MNTLSEAIVLVTGGSAGIGLACARTFAKKGAHVVLIARGQDRLDEAVSLIHADGGAATAIVADISSPLDCDAALAEVEQRFGRLDILVNNAGLHHRGPFLDNDADELAAMIDVNLKSPIRLTRRVLPLMLKTGGVIINVASLAGCIPVPNSTVYSASKFGMRAFSLALHAELEGTGITVCCVSPGPVDTGFIMDHLDTVSDITFSQPIVTAQQVADAILACSIDGKAERKLPRSSGLLTTMGYLFPSLRRILRGRLEKKGRRIRRRLMDERRGPNKPT